MTEAVACKKDLFLIGLGAFLIIKKDFPNEKTGVGFFIIYW